MRTFFTMFDKFYREVQILKKLAYTLNINYFSIFVHAKDIYHYNVERVMRRCGGIYSVFYVSLKLIHMQ
jgi:hypothetical protein